MDYELAKKLKEKGFPQNWKNNFYANPTLSELIEACGDKFHQLTYFKKHNLWGASAQSSEGLDLSAHKTAEIAVANLWLQLHK